jgi:hypothetical protein
MRARAAAAAARGRIGSEFACFTCLLLDIPGRRRSPRRRPRRAAAAAARRARARRYLLQRSATEPIIGLGAIYSYHAPATAALCVYVPLGWCWCYSGDGRCYRAAPTTTA